MEPAATPGSDARPGIASLPMYDWPEIRVPTDALWTAIRAELIRKGIDAPASLDGNGNPETLWTAPDLVLSQTCGFPYANGLSGKVALIATPAYRIDGATPGTYFSVLVARSPGRRKISTGCGTCAWLSTWRTPSLALPRPSGFLRIMVSSRNPEPVETGAHRASIQAVAAGTADWAAIDAVAWELALRHEPAAADLTVFARTPETPALPLISSMRMAHQAARVADAVAAAIKRLDPSIAGSLLLSGLVRSNRRITHRWQHLCPSLEVLPGFRRK
jgi:hypothetical protein